MFDFIKRLFKKEEYEPELPDWVRGMNKIYENPRDWQSDNKMQEKHECIHCGAPCVKRLCEYCGQDSNVVTRW